MNLKIDLNIIKIKLLKRNKILPCKSPTSVICFLVLVEIRLIFFNFCNSLIVSSIISIIYFGCKGFFYW
jgi:hypothetical protein